MGKQSKLLLDSNQMITLQTQLAIVVGDRAAIALQQIHYWCDVSQRQAKREHYKDEQWWVYNTWSEWQTNNFPFWSVSTVRRIFRDLEEIGVVISRAHADQNKGFWITVNYGALETLATVGGRDLKVRRLAKIKAGGAVQFEQTGGVQNEQGGLFNLNSGAVQNEQPTSDPESTRKEDSESVNERASTHVPFHMAQGLGSRSPKFNALVLAVKAHPVFQAYVRGRDGIEPEVHAPTAETMLDGCNAIQADIDAGRYTLQDVEDLTRSKVNDGREFLFGYIKSDIVKFLKSKPSAKFVSEDRPEIGMYADDQPADYDPLTHWMPVKPPGYPS